MGLTFKSTLQDVFNLLVERDFRAYINDKPMDGPLDNPEWYINQDYIEFRRKVIGNIGISTHINFTGNLSKKYTVQKENSIMITGVDITIIATTRFLPATHGAMFLSPALPYT